jgi:hypothetical protein
MSLLEKTAIMASHEGGKETAKEFSSATLKNARMPYMKQKRFYGEGDIRIGTCLRLNDDIYCCGFIAYLSDDIIKKTLNIMTGELKV